MTFSIGKSGLSKKYICNDRLNLEATKTTLGGSNSFKRRLDFLRQRCASIWWVFSYSDKLKIVTQSLQTIFKIKG